MSRHIQRTNILFMYITFFIFFFFFVFLFSLFIEIASLSRGSKETHSVCSGLCSQTRSWLVVLALIIADDLLLFIAFSKSRFHCASNASTEENLKAEDLCLSLFSALSEKKKKRPT